MLNVKDIERYGKRIEVKELDITIHQFIYEFEDNWYLITKVKGEVASAYKLATELIYYI